jgi:N6-L-threonylcarbamoyladenine synthase
MRFPRARTAQPLDFSFSGVKTALLRYVEDHPGFDLADIAASYQAAIVDVLVEHTVRAAELTGARHVGVGGGVAANSFLRRRLPEECEKRGLTCTFPPIRLCTDNAGMIAAVGHSLLSRGVRDGLDLETFARSPLTEQLYTAP